VKEALAGVWADEIIGDSVDTPTEAVNGYQPPRCPGGAAVGDYSQVSNGPRAREK
jgi:hypothetical protein